VIQNPELFTPMLQNPDNIGVYVDNHIMVPAFRNARQKAQDVTSVTFWKLRDGKYFQYRVDSGYGKKPGSAEAVRHDHPVGQAFEETAALAGPSAQLLPPRLPVQHDMTGVVPGIDPGADVDARGVRLEKFPGRLTQYPRA